MLPLSNTPMNALHALTEGLFDYAGMFPPASRSLEEAIEESIAFPSALRNPRLVGGDLVCGSEKLQQLKELLPRWTDARRRPLGLCLLMPELGSKAWDDVCEAIKGESIALRSVECKVTEGLEEGLQALSEWSERCSFRGIIALEPTPLPDLDALHTLAKGLKASNAEAGEALFALKIRGNSVERNSLATIIALCSELGLPLKLTQLLHHPIIENQRYGNHLGFLTVSLAWCLAARTSITPVELQECLGISKVEDLRFEGEVVSWRSYSLHSGEISETRQGSPLSIGSCSISEPDEDLARLFEK